MSGFASAWLVVAQLVSSAPGDFEVVVHARDGLSGYSSALFIRGDANGANIVHDEECPKCEANELNGLFRGHLSAEETRRLVAQLKQFRPAEAPVDRLEHCTDVGDASIHIRLGARTQNFVLPDRCSSAEDDLLNRLWQVREHATAIDAPPVAELAFSPPKTVTRFACSGRCEGSTADGYRCRAPLSWKQLDALELPWRMKSVELPWCELKGANTFSCFRSPFDSIEFVIDAGKQPIPEAKATRPAPIAAVLPSGEQCALEGHDWECSESTKLNAVHRSGHSWLAVTEDGAIIELSAVYLR
ncbi:MAG: hypothetical protein QM723_32170 [Myxococcaceae bacterium]